MILKADQREEDDRMNDEKLAQRLKKHDENAFAKDKLRKLSPTEITDISELHDLSAEDMPVAEDYENKELYKSLKEEVSKNPTKKY